MSAGKICVMDHSLGSVEYFSKVITSCYPKQILTLNCCVILCGAVQEREQEGEGTVQNYFFFFSGIRCYHFKKLALLDLIMSATFKYLSAVYSS